MSNPFIGNRGNPRPTFHDALAAGLPQGRDDEPATLRQDILDELNDHLTCAWRRELLRSGGLSNELQEQGSGQAQAELWQRVEQRFGDPRALARRLWFDAMWSRIMNQRLQLVAMFVLAVASIGSVALAWKTLSASQTLAEQSQASNAELLRELKALMARPVAPTAPVVASEWNQMRISCVAEKTGGRPLPGVLIKCSSVENNSGIPPKTVLTDNDGVADMGLVRFGSYRVVVNIEGKLLKEFRVAVHPGERCEQTIVCPPADVQMQVPLRITVPDIGLSPELKARIWHQVEIQRYGSATGEWSVVTKPTMGESFSVFVAPDGRLWQIADPSRGLGHEYYELPDSDQVVEIVARPGREFFSRYASERIVLSSEVQPVDALTLPQGGYSVRYRGLALRDDADPASIGLLMLRKEITILTLSLTGRLTSQDGGAEGLPLRIDGRLVGENDHVVAWPSTEPWSMELAKTGLEALQFLAGFPAESVPVALLPDDFPTRTFPTIGPNDRIDFLLDDQVVLSAVPPIVRQINSYLKFGGHRSHVVGAYRFCSLLPVEVERFRQIQKQEKGPDAARRFTLRIRPGTADESRGTLAPDFDERVKAIVATSKEL